MSYRRKLVCNSKCGSRYSHRPILVWEYSILYSWKYHLCGYLPPSYVGVNAYQWQMVTSVGSTTIIVYSNNCLGIQGYKGGIIIFLYQKITCSQIRSNQACHPAIDPLHKYNDLVKDVKLWGVRCKSQHHFNIDARTVHPRG